MFPGNDFQVEQHDQKSRMQGLVALFLVAAIVVFTLLLTSCVSLDETLANDKGHKARCRGMGAGIIGSIVATANHDECLKDLRERGYK